MSLDVYLKLDRNMEGVETDIVIWDDTGDLRKLMYSEWKEKFPDFLLDEIEETETIFWKNITHNLNIMAEKAGIYKHLWRPDEIGIEKAEQLIEPLQIGLNALRSNPDYYRVFNPENGWGNYEGLVEFVAEYLSACKQHPEARIRVSR